MRRCCTAAEIVNFALWGVKNRKGYKITMKKEKSTNRIYGAYGSNLNLGQMSWRCPDAKPFKTGFVNGYKLTFRRGGYANIEPADGCKVPVLLWEISKTDETSLNRYEGYPKFYIKVDLPVETGDGTVMAMFYVMADRYTTQAVQPTDAYLHTLHEGYLDNNLPIEYLEQQVGKALIEISTPHKFP